MTNEMITWVNAYTDDETISGSTTDFTVCSQPNGEIIVTRTSDGKQFYQYFFHERNYSTKTILAKGVVERTSLIQETELKIVDYIYEMDRYIILDIGSSIYEIIRDKAYDIAEEVLSKALRDDEYTLLDADEDEVIEEMVQCIDFESLYEIIDEILNAPCTMEEKLAEVGMSIHDFI